MALTEALVARTRRPVVDPGPTPGARYMNDEDYGAVRDRLLAEAPPGPLRVFAYGSLLWKPVADLSGGAPAVVPGWHRSFCFRVQRFRGTIDQPGLMMALDRGGRCRGVLYEVTEPIGTNLDIILRREMTILPSVNVPRWVKVENGGGAARALAFVVDPSNPRYIRLEKAEIARVLASAVGHWGSCADYLFETVRHLDSLGIRDRNLWHLQALVAAEITSQPSATDG